MWIERAPSLAEHAYYPGWHARCLRAEGEAFERLGRPEGAKAAYERRPEIDPRLGARKRLAALGAAPAPVARSSPTQPAIVDERPYATTVCPSRGVEFAQLPKAKVEMQALRRVHLAPRRTRWAADLLRGDQLEAHE